LQWSDYLSFVILAYRPHAKGTKKGKLQEKFLAFPGGERFLPPFCPSDANLFLENTRSLRQNVPAKVVCASFMKEKKERRPVTFSLTGCGGTDIISWVKVYPISFRALWPQAA
jgi:hypothetical protein